MDIISAYREVGTYRGAAQICATTHKTVRRVVERAEAGGDARRPAPRARNFESVAELVAKRVDTSKGRISAKRLDFGPAPVPSKRYTIWVHTWSEIIRNAMHRHKFVQDSLNYTTSHDLGVEHLRERHNEYLPDALKVELPDGDPSSDVGPS